MKLKPVDYLATLGIAALASLTPGRSRRRVRRPVQPTATVQTLDGRLYHRSTTGALLRISPLRPWRGKSERRQVLQQRRAARAAAHGQSAIRNPQSAIL
jgi:hypothetical protein